MVSLNKHPEKAADCDLGVKINSQSIIATILSGDCVDAYNDIESPNRVIPETRQLQVNDGHITIPAHSLVIIENFRYETVFQYNVD